MDFWLSIEGQMVNPVLILLFYKFSAEMSRAVGKAKVLLSAKALLAGAGLANAVLKCAAHSWGPVQRSHCRSGGEGSELRSRCSWLHFCHCQISLPAHSKINCPSFLF